MSFPLGKSNSRGFAGSASARRLGFEMLRALVAVAILYAAAVAAIIFGE